ncbi:MAG TPA: hypothetical protein VFH45_04550, partial [Acidimicrobiales bacterium]|nr:hypothetical protein [Acidimicrobiales bacterium]
MAGSIKARPDRGPNVWELRVFIGRDGAGRPKQKSRLYRGTRRAAERELARFWVEVDQDPPPVSQPAPAAPTGGIAPVPSGGRTWGPATTINDALAAWRDSRWEELSPATVARYRGIWTRYVENTLGPRRIVDVTPYDAEEFFHQLKRVGLGQGSVRYTRAMLSRACRLARKWSMSRLPNPFEDTELPQ